MKIPQPFEISARLLPALKVGEAWISLQEDGATFVLDLPDGSEHIVDDVRYPACGRRDWREHFAALCSFLSACAESRRYVAHDGGRGENAGLFSEPIGEWAESVLDELAMLECEIEELIASTPPAKGAQQA